MYFITFPRIYKLKQVNPGIVFFRRFDAIVLMRNSSIQRHCAIPQENDDILKLLINKELSILV